MEESQVKFLKSKFLIKSFMVLSGILSQAANAAMISTFDSGNDGWGAFPDQADVTHFATGGNPGGFIELLDLAPGAENVVKLFAPSSFKGDLRSYDGGVFSMDMMQVSFDPGQPEIPGLGIVRITNSSAGMTHELDIVPGPLPLGSWGSYSTSFSASAWGLSQADWDIFLSDVSEVLIIGESYGNAINERIAFDNIGLTAVPVPAAAWLFGSGIIAIFGFSRTQSTKKDK